ncbi:nuclease-related domain-containing protein [Neobacillus sp. SAB-20_R2A]|uniref:nuclease-related domain-containing protein n=1 Tax=Neobacillus sp. SAB-20_R2A TaxID=3120519 RepID=UPI003C6E0733
MKTLFDKGNYGEFLTFAELEKLKGPKRLLTNLYLPKYDGTTTEVDLIMLHETGLYVFESKNYSGWIFGDEKSKNWMQVFPNKQKEKFFNPVWQNKAHITALKSTLGRGDEYLIKSYIVFSERCTLKKINVTSQNVKVLKRNAMLSSIKKEITNTRNIMTQIEIDRMYTILHKFSLADSNVKQAHIKQIQMKR